MLSWKKIFPYVHVSLYILANARVRLFSGIKSKARVSCRLPRNVKNINEVVMEKPFHLFRPRVHFNIMVYFLPYIIPSHHPCLRK